MDQPRFSNADRPPIELSLHYTCATLANSARKVGSNRIEIPKGSLVPFLPKYAAFPDVLRIMIDQAVTEENMKRLSGPGEVTSVQRQPSINGRRRIHATTTRATLNMIAINVIRRLLPEACDGIFDDVIMTRMGFRSDYCNGGGLIDRLTALLLIVRRGIELRQAVSSSDDLPLIFWETPQQFNQHDWDVPVGTIHIFRIFLPDPSFASITPQHHAKKKQQIGRKCRVAFDDGAKYLGEFVAYDPTNDRYLIDYEDGETEWTKFPDDAIEIMPKPMNSDVTSAHPSPQPSTLGDGGPPRNAPRVSATMLGSQSQPAMQTVVASPGKILPHPAPQSQTLGRRRRSATVSYAEDSGSSGDSDDSDVKPVELKARKKPKRSIAEDSDDSEGYEPDKKASRLWKNGPAAKECRRNKKEYVTKDLAMVISGPARTVMHHLFWAMMLTLSC